jgi:uncharacterized membrane protein YdjX (TVP38/TMEM64 family)
MRPVNKKIFLFLLFIVSLVATGVAAFLMGGISPDRLQLLLNQTGVWTPLIYIAIYVLATVLILPSTALNLTAGAIFGLWWGTLWTSIAAILAAVVSFSFTRTVGRDVVALKLGRNFREMDDRFQQGGIFYMFALRLLPIIPYGLVNFTAGLTSIKFRDYFLGTLLGTVPGILPFVMLGSFGLRAIQTGEILPLLGALSLIALLVVGATWYKRKQ